MFSLVRALPSPTSAGIDFPLFGWFIGTTAQSDFSGACAPALWLSAFAGRSRSESDRDAPEISRFSCMLFLSVPGFLDYAGPSGHSRSVATWCVAFPVGNRVQRPNSAFFEAQSPKPTDTPVYASTAASRRHPQDSGPRWIRSLLSCRTLSFPTTCRFIPAHFRKRGFTPVIGKSPERCFGCSSSVFHYSGGSRSGR